jgi:prohead serine protease
MRGTKQIQLSQIKAGPDDGLDEGEVEALFTVYGAKDSYRQRVPGGDSLKSFADGVNDGSVTIPVVWQHQLNDPWLYVGEAKSIDLEATGKNGEQGASVRMQFDVDENPTAKQAYKQIKGRRVPNWSYRWSGTATKASDGVEDLSDMEIQEFSPVLMGAVTQTHTLNVKSADGRKSYVDIDVPGSYENVQDAITDALREKYPMGDNLPWASLVATMSDRACYQLCGGEDDDELFWVSYTIGDDGDATLGDPTPAQATLKADGEKAWDGAASNYTDEEYAKACILDRGADAGTAKERYGLPIAKPGESSSANPDADGVHAAASRIGQVSASDDAKSAAYRRLAAAYRKIGEDVPDSIAEHVKGVPMSIVDTGLKLLADLPPLEPVA